MIRLGGAMHWHMANESSPAFAGRPYNMGRTVSTTRDDLGSCRLLSSSGDTAAGAGGGCVARRGRKAVGARCSGYDSEEVSLWITLSLLLFFSSQLRRWIADLYWHRIGCVLVVTGDDVSFQSALVPTYQRLCRGQLMSVRLAFRAWRFVWAADDERSMMLATH